MSPMRLLCASITLVFSVLFSFANNNPKNPISPVGDTEGVLTPDCSLTASVDFLDCDELKISWSESGNPMSVEIRVLVGGQEQDVIQTYGNAYSIYYLQNMTLQIRPFVFAPAEPCPWQDLTIPTNPYNTCDNCIQAYMPTAFRIIPIQDGSCQNFLVVYDGLTNIQISGVLDQQTQTSLNFTFNPANDIITVLNPISPYSIYSFDFSFVNVNDGSYCQSSLAVNTGNCDGTEIDLALTVTGNNSGLSMSVDHELEVNVYNQSNEFVDPVFVTIFLPTQVSAGINPVWLPAGPGEYVTAVNILPNETLSIPFNFNSTQLGQFEIIAEISDMNGLDDLDSYPDDDATNDVYLGDNIIDQNGKNGEDEDDHDKYFANFTQDYYDLALTITSPTIEVVAGNTVTYTVNVYNQGTVAVDHPEIAIQIPELCIMEGGPEFEQAFGQKFFYTLEQNIAPGAQASFSFDVVTYPDDNTGNVVTEAIAEIKSFKDFANAPGMELTDDTDSQPDDILNDDIFGGNDIIDGSNNDEDDHDQEELTIETLAADLPSLVCGQTYTPTDLANNIRVAIAVGQVVWINDFPMKVATIASGGSSLLYSGSAYMSVPFLHEESKLMVNFTGLEVAELNGEYHAFGGVVNGKEMPNRLLENLQNFPVFSCTPSNEQENGGDDDPRDRQYDSDGYDQWGFDENGNFRKPPYPGWEEGDPYDEDYDPNGFDKDGNHRSGGKYDECGCDQMGFDRNGVKCEEDCHGCPYYWIDPEACETEEGVTFFNDIDDFDQEVEDSKDEITTDLEDEIDFRRNSCEQIRVLMNPIIQQHDAVQIKGEQEEYFIEGMNENFHSPPERFASQSSTRKQSLIDLQNYHVELYECDLELSKLKDRLDFLENMSPEQEQDLKDAMEIAIKQFTQEQVDRYSDDEEFEQWKLDFINKWVDQQMNEDVVFIHYPSFNTTYANTASLNGEVFALHPEDILMEYLNGHKDIYGVDRNYLTQYFALQQAYGQEDAVINGNNYNLVYQPFQIEDEPRNGVFRYVFIDDVEITPTTAKVSAIASITENKMGQTIFFEANNIPILPSGFDLSSPLAQGDMIKLELAQNTAIQFNNTTRINLLSKNDGHVEGTFITFNCDGFDEIVINGNAQLCESYFIELNEDYEPTGNDVFTTNFKAGPIKGWNEFIAEIDMGNFAIKDLENVRFSLDHLVLDHSETETHGSFSPPGNSGKNYGPDWQGIFIKDISVVVEKEMRATGDLTEISGQDIVIDGAGFSGRVEYNDPILEMDESDIDGWGLSIESFYLDILSHQMNQSGVGITGKLDLPLFEDKSENHFQYDAGIGFNKHFVFSARLPQNPALKVPILAGNVLLTSPTGATLSYKNGAFLADATIAGKLSISKNKGEDGSPTDVSISGITLPTLHLSNHVPPYIGISGDFGDPEVAVDIAGFRLTLNEIMFGEDDNGDQKLGFDLGLNILKSDVASLRTTTGIAVTGSLDRSSRHRWEFKKFSIDNVQVRGNFSKFEGIRGELNWFEEGDEGFEGEGLAGLVSVGGIQLAENSNFSLGLSLGLISGRSSTGVDYYLFDLGIDKDYRGNIPYKEGINLTELNVMYAKNLLRAPFPNNNNQTGLNQPGYSLANTLSGYSFTVNDGATSFNGSIGLASSLKKITI